MDISVYSIADLFNTCASTEVESDHAALLEKLLHIYPELKFEHILSRGGWYRTGGVVNSQGQSVTDNLRKWVESESDGDINKLLDRYAESDFIATRLLGKTHYFVAQIGDAAKDFVQLEVEELQEVQDHYLLNEDCLAEDIEDIIDPSDTEKLSPEPVAELRYLFRKMTSISDFIHTMTEKMLGKNKAFIPIQRFMQDWDRSSSKEARCFCQHWVLALQEHTDAWGEPIMQAKPVSTYQPALPQMEVKAENRGSTLATLVHGFDHKIGYPMAWYFFMLSHREVPFQLAEVIHKDLMGAYDYLPAKDLKILKDWSETPYGI
ncbi:hypothetical protein MNBD_GAMMA25-1755 [hydrothermal vent metagenome]|uniref:Uncharacterized protein n=1 Tax=hydrothermal vent metagenome TaxID=652676 RepID=A0A3B1BFC3_9ZZZZ